MKQKLPSQNGFTILETLVSFIILVSIAVPLITVMYSGKGITDNEKTITAMCILEQEAALVKLFPERTIPEKRRIINGKEWKIKTEVSGNSLLKYKMRVYDNVKARGEVFFYGHD
jgi:hypothetical protein